MGPMAAQVERVRSPQVLRPLIVQQIELGYRAGGSFFKHAGLMLLEARKGIPASRAWAKYVASCRYEGPEGVMMTPSKSQAAGWMRLGRSELLGLGHKGVESAKKDPRTRAPETAGRGLASGFGTRIVGPGGTGGARGGAAARVADGEETPENTEKRRAAFRIQRKAERAEMVLLINAGYKQLAMKRHPDKGGSTEAMTLLREVRDRLIEFAETWG